VGGSRPKVDDMGELDERDYVATVEAADPDELARLISSPTAREEEVLVAHFGQQRYERMHEHALQSRSGTSWSCTGSWGPR
jgi:hypothetical protein